MNTFLPSSARPSLGGLLAAVVAGWAAAASAAAPEAPAAPVIDPAPVVPSSARDVVALYRATHRVGYGVTIPDGFVDGGRGMKLAADGRAGSSRELLTVNRERDEVLRRALAFAASPEVRGLPTSERMRRIADHVSATFSKRRDRVAPYADDQAMADACRGRGVLLGDVPALCNTGVCRHESLLFKLMADEAGLDAAIVRGGYQKEERDRPGAHAWCEVEQDDGSVVVVDTMRSKGWFITMADPRAARYFDVGQKPMYGATGRRQHVAIVAVDDPPFVGKATIRVVSPEAGGQVRYTLDGSEPTSESPLAEGPLTISRSCLVKAAAFAADGSLVDRTSRQVVVLAAGDAGRRPDPAVPSAN